jgi:ssDNA-binding replication factor A large subunit
MEKVDLKVRVVGLNEPRNVTTYTGLEHVLVDGEVEDDTGRVLITVWDKAIEQLKGIEVDDVVELQNCFITSFKGTLHVNVGRDSKVIPADRRG